MAQSVFSQRRKKAPAPAVAPKEEASLLAAAGRGALSSLAWGAGALGKFSRATWGTASGLTGGEWGGGLLNAIPFSDTLGLTDESKGIQAGDFAEKRLGILPANQPGFDRWDIPRFALDVAGDPLTYLGSGLLGKAGGAARSTGVADDVVRSTMAKSGVGWREGLSKTTGRDVLKYASEVGVGPAARRAYFGAAKKAGVKVRDIIDQPIGGLGYGLPGQSNVRFAGKAAEVASRIIDKPGQLFRNVRGRALGKTGAELVQAASEGVERNRVAQEASQAFGKQADQVMRQHDAYAVQWAQRTKSTPEDYFSRLDVKTGDLVDDITPKVGDEVQWTVNGSDQFKTPQVIKDIQDGPDGKQYAMFDGQGTGVPLEQVSKIRGTDTLYQPDIEQLAARMPDTPRVRQFLDEFRVGQASGNGVPDATIGEGLAKAASDAWGKAGSKADDALTKLQFKLSDEAWGAVEKAIGRDGMEALDDTDRFIELARPQVNKIATAAEEALRKHRPWENVTGKQLLDEGRKILAAGEADDLIGAISQAAGRRLGDIDGYYSRANDLISQSAGDLLYQAGRGAVQFKPGMKATISAFKARDISTFVHESAHVFRRFLGEGNPALLDAVEKALGIKDGQWTKDAEEVFARAFEKYIAEGKAPSPVLQRAFEKLKGWLQSIYKNTAGSPLGDEISPEMRKVFDSMLSPLEPRGTWTNSRVGNAIRALFDPASGGRWDRAGQEVSQLAYAANRRNAPRAVEALERVIDEVRAPLAAFEQTFESAFRGGAKGGLSEGMRVSVGGLQGEISRIGKKTASVFFKNPKTGEESFRRVPIGQIVPDTGKALQSSRMYAGFNKVLRLVAEGGSFDDGLRIVEQELKLRPGSLTGRQNTAAVKQAMETAVNKMRTERDPLFESWLAKGGNSQFLDNHAPRYVDTDDVAAIEAARQRVTKNIPAAYVNEMMNDKALRSGDAAAMDRLMSEYVTTGRVKLDNDYVSELRPKMTGAQVHAEDILSYVNDHPLKSMYIRDFLADNAKYLQAAIRGNSTLDAIHEMVKRSASEGGDVSLRQAFVSSGMDVDSALKWQSKVTGIPVEQLERMRLPEEVVKALKGMAKMETDPEWFKRVGGWIDSFHKLFKESVTIQPAFVGYFFRNHVSGLFMNFASGNIENLSDARLYRKAYQSTIQDIKNGFSSVTQDELKDLQRYRVLGDTGFEGVDTYQAAPPDPFAWGNNVEQVRPQNPLQFRETWRESQQAVAQNPIGGVAGAIGEQFPALGRAGQAARTAWNANVRTGGKMNQNVEWVNRVSLYRYLKEKGYSSAAAAMEVHRAHFDYGDLTQFEKGVMKRVIPFYSFSRKMAEQFADTLISRPGGLMAQSIKASAGEQEPGTPDHVASTAAIPLGDLPDGSRRYLTGFGLPTEDPVGFLGGGVRGALLEGLSRTSPLIKGPLEWATGESFFQTGPSGGRDLRDMDPALGRLISNVTGAEEAYRLPEGVEQVISNSPLTRYITLGRTLTDSRKGLGAKAASAFTGLRIADVSPAARDATLRETINDAARRAGARAFERVSFEKGADLTPDQKELQDAINALVRRAKDRAAKRKAPEKKATSKKK
jgi:hypothetical protein